MTIEAVREAGGQLGIAPTCAALGLPTATYYRRITPKPPPEPRPSPPRTPEWPLDESTNLFATGRQRNVTLFGELAGAAVLNPLGVNN